VTWKVVYGYSDATKSPEIWLMLACVVSKSCWLSQKFQTANEEIKKMFALVSIFLTALLIAVTSVMLYRLVRSWKGLNRILVGRPKAATNKMKLNTQQGYMRLASFPHGGARMSARRVVQNTANGEIKAPWGW